MRPTNLQELITKYGGQLELPSDQVFYISLNPFALPRGPLTQSCGGQFFAEQWPMRNPNFTKTMHFMHARSYARELECVVQSWQADDYSVGQVGA